MLFSLRKALIAERFSSLIAGFFSEERGKNGEDGIMKEKGLGREGIPQRFYLYSYRLVEREREREV